MADLFPQVEDRMRIARAFEHWQARCPWRWAPDGLQPHLFREFFVESEVRSLHG